MTQRKQLLSVFVVAIVFFTIALWGFPDSPSPWFDEGINLGIAKTFAEDGVYSLRLAPDTHIRERSLMMSTNYPLLGFISLAFKLFGVGLAQAKVVMILFLAAFLVLTFILVRRLSQSSAIAFGSILLVITFLPFYGNGLSGGIGEVAGLVYLFAGLLLLEKNKPWQVFLTGVFFGLAAATKVIYLSVVFCFIAAECWAAWRERGFPWKRWLVLSVGGAIPLIIWVTTLIPREGTLVDFFRTYAYYRNPYQATGHTFTTNLLKFFTETTPFHFLLLFCAVAAAFLMQRQWEDHRRLKIVLAVFVAINAIWFLATPGWYRYLFPAHLVVLVLFPIALHDLASRFTSQWVKKYSTVFVVSALVLVQSVHLIRERDSKLYYNPTPRLAALQIDNDFGETSDLLIVDQPELWFLSKNPSVRQYFRANPYAAFGEDIFSENGKLPHYIVTSVLERSGYLTEHREQFDTSYALLKQYGPYTVYQRK